MNEIKEEFQKRSEKRYANGGSYADRDEISSSINYLLKHFYG